jgi:hypothetical protein
MPERPAISWTIREVDPGRGYTIGGGGFLENAQLQVRWRFDAVSDHKTKLTQRIELSGENAVSYIDGIRTAFEPNLEPGMGRIAGLMAQAWLQEGRTAEPT